MKAFLLSLAVLLTVLGSTPAQVPCPPYRCPVPVLPQAPDACGPGYYATNSYGQPYGPNYWLLPPGGPYNGAIFARQATGFPGSGGQGNCNNMGAMGAGFPGFTTHPYARSPRDFFMME